MDGKVLDALIDQLEVVLKTGKSLAVSEPDWRVVWAKAAEIQDAFRVVRYPRKQERDDAWTRFVAIRDEASALHQRERDERRSRSEHHRDRILRHIEATRPHSLFGFDPPDIAEMKNLGKTLREGGKMLSASKEEMLAEHKQTCFDRIIDIQKIHDAWWSHLKQIGSTQLRDRIRINLEKNHERHRKASEALAYHRSRADELRAKIASAYNPRWAEGASQRLAEIADKIEAIEQSIRQIERWIQNDEEQLNRR